MSLDGSPPARRSQSAWTFRYGKCARFSRSGSNQSRWKRRLVKRKMHTLVISSKIVARFHPRRRHRYHLKEMTEQVLNTLTPREERIIKMRFGLEDGTEYTLEEVGQNFAVTRERIRQIEAKALRKLRHPSRSRRLRAFLDGTGRD